MAYQMVEGGVKLTLAHPVPSFENPFRPQLQRIEVETKPFSFDSRTQEMFQRREERLNSIIEEEQKVTVAVSYYYYPASCECDDYCLYNAMQCMDRI